MTGAVPRRLAALRHPGALLRAADPGLLASKRAVRAAIVMPASFAIGLAITSDTQVGLFSSFGAFALMMFVDLGGTRADRLRGYLALVAVAMPLIAVGTLCSTRSVLAVAGMAVVGFAVLFAGVLSPQAALGGMYLLIAFVLPVSVPVPPGQILPRLGGWALAAALAVPSILLIWPRPWHDDRRAALASSARCLAALAQAHADGRSDRQAAVAAAAELRILRDRFDATAYPPGGTGPAEIALAKMVSRAEWVGAKSAVSPGAAALGLPHVRAVYREVAEALRAIAAVVPAGRGQASGRPAAAALRAALGALHRAREFSLGPAVDTLIAGATENGAGAGGGCSRAPGAGNGGTRAGTGSAAAAGDRAVPAFLIPLFRARSLGFATEMLGVLALEAAGARPPAAGAEPGAGPPLTARQVILRVARSHLTLRSVWLRNSLRGAAGLALAVAIARATGVSHGFWVVLGALSVLRSNAIGTGVTAVRALAGTVAGFVIGTVVMVGLGSHLGGLWLVLPVAVLAAGGAPSLISFAAGQAGFTVMVIILFNILVPAGWSVGLVRVTDVAIGCAVSLAVGLLLWPRGAAAELGRALSDGYATGSDYLAAAIARLVSPRLAGTTRSQAVQAVAAYRRLDDAYRQFLSERGTKGMSLRTATDLVTGAIRLRLAAHSLATLPVRPINSWPPAGHDQAAAAAGALRQACCGIQAWYLGFAGVLSGAEARVPAPGDDDAALHGQLISVFEAARTAGDEPAVRLAVRLLWAAEELEDGRALQRELAGEASAFVSAHGSGPRLHARTDGHRDGTAP